MWPCPPNCNRVFVVYTDLFVFEWQVGEYSDPFDLKKANAEKEALESASTVMLPLSDNYGYSVPYEMKDRHRGKPAV